MFTGFTEDTYQFFWELAFHNDKSFFEANRARYRKNVYEPLAELTAALSPTVQAIDERLVVRPASAVSRIRRDTRYSHDKSPYRDHAWISFRLPNNAISEGLTLYAEIERDSYGYGMGMYAPNPAVMNPLRERMLAKPKKFLSLVQEPEFAGLFTLEGERYKRPRYTDAQEALIPYVNLRNISFCFSSGELSRTLSPALADEVEHAFRVLQPVYRFLLGLDS